MATVEFTEARMENGWLCLRVRNRPQARQTIAGMQPGRCYTATIKKRREKRSLDANAYFWVLVDKLAEETGIRADTIYRDLIQNVGGVSEGIVVREAAVRSIIAGWERNGLGWFAYDLGPSKIPGYHNVRLYYGSSVYDTKQMARLIDLAIQECQQFNIETLPPRKLEILKEGWTV